MRLSSLLILAPLLVASEARNIALPSLAPPPPAPTGRVGGPSTSPISAILNQTQIGVAWNPPLNIHLGQTPRPPVYRGLVTNRLDCNKMSPQQVQVAYDSDYRCKFFASRSCNGTELSGPKLNNATYSGRVGSGKLWAIMGFNSYKCWSEKKSNRTKPVWT
ncbi:hypothetical protein B0J11DRAFT_211511 [Dendryphion nanum]|uniref:Uncharacterized protein n=1 Tax=Dendryphion nanum TaxID=256645 RepID=A0A9P9E6T2_9PLEO|nr:hypothetical protein B0J11DRAFT_211511 [Dendryphion nanum]